MGEMQVVGALKGGTQNDDIRQIYDVLLKCGLLAFHLESSINLLLGNFLAYFLHFEENLGQ